MGKPISAPPRVYTKSELADMAYGHWQSDCSEIYNQIIMAQANGDTELVAELQEEKQEYLAKYQEILDKIEAGQITNPEELEAEYQDEE
jgi:hypothetical protein